jgi:hypothetical protein
MFVAEQESFDCKALLFRLQEDTNRIMVRKQVAKSWVIEWR